MVTARPDPNSKNPADTAWRAMSLRFMRASRRNPPDPLPRALVAVVIPERPSPCPSRKCLSSTSRFEQLDRIPVRIFDLDLSTSRTSLHLVATPRSGQLQFSDERWRVGNLQDDPIPAAGLLRLTVRHRPRARCARATQQNLLVTDRHPGKRRKLLVSQREAEVLHIERHGASDVLHLIANAMKALDEGVSFDSGFRLGHLDLLSIKTMWTERT